MQIYALQTAIVNPYIHQQTRAMRRNLERSRDPDIDAQVQTCDAVTEMNARSHALLRSLDPMLQPVCANEQFFFLEMSCFGPFLHE